MTIDHSDETSLNIGEHHAPENTSPEDTSAGDTTFVEYWDHKRTAAELGVTPETLYVWVNAGGGPPATRHGRRRRYRPAEVRAYRRALAERFP